MLRNRNRGKRHMGAATAALVVLTTWSSCEGSFAQSVSGNARSVKGWSCVKSTEYLRDRRGRPIWLRSSRLMNRVLKKQPIDRPSLLGKSGLRGEVIVQVLINSQGKVECVRAVRGHPLAISSAIDCVSKWVFNPYSVNGGATKSVLGILSIPYDFTR